MSRFPALFCTLILFSASLRAEDCPWFQWKADGSFTAGGLPFRLVHSSTKWETSEQNSGPHLHLEMINADGVLVDPMTLLGNATEK